MTLHLEPALFAPLMMFFRAAGLCASAPLFGLKGVPPVVRVVAALSLTVWLWTLQSGPGSAPVLRADAWWWPALLETGTGLLAGWTARLGLEASVGAGHAFSAATGLSFGSTLDPQHGAESTALATLVSTTTLATALAMGLHHNVVRWLWASLWANPPGSMHSLSGAAQHTVECALVSLPLGVQLAAPALIASTGTQLLLGVASRSAAQLNLSTLGMMASVMGGGAAVFVTAGWVVQRGALHAVEMARLWHG
jgi:flagellar biosynthesis protein FliR